LVDHFFPPVAAHEEERENQAYSEQNCQDVATVVGLVGLVAHNKERPLVQRNLHSLVEVALLHVEGGESVKIVDC